ncbi:MAG: hypothetical protein FWD14_06410 [Treponema sp.]|nr:hypothetical protein [Treponema sp.]
MNENKENISDLILELYTLGDLSSEEMAIMDRAIEKDEILRKRYEELKTSIDEVSKLFKLEDIPFFSKLDDDIDEGSLEDNLSLEVESQSSQVSDKLKRKFPVKKPTKINSPFTFRITKERRQSVNMTTIDNNDKYFTIIEDFIEEEDFCGIFELLGITNTNSIEARFQFFKDKNKKEPLKSSDITFDIDIEYENNNILKGIRLEHKMESIDGVIRSSPIPFAWSKSFGEFKITGRKHIKPNE